MGIRKRFLCLTMLAALVLVLVSSVGYYNAQKHLSDSLEQKMDAVVDFKADEVDSWLSVKGQNAIAIGSMLRHVEPGAVMRKELTSSMEADPDLQEFLNGNEQGQYVKWGKSSVPADFDPRTRGWYKAAKAAGGLIFTDAYVDVLTGKTVVTAAYPYKNAMGAFAGALCIDISLDTLNGQIEKINLNGNGAGFILDKSGNVVAHADQSRMGKKLSDDPIFQSHAQEIMMKDNGRISYEKDGRQMILAYAKAHQTGWVIGMEIPEDVVYGDLASLKMIYGIIIFIGILVLMVVCLQFAGKITRPILSLTAAADRLADGDLRVEKLTVHTRDEIGRLTMAFNAMSDNLRGLIHNVSDSSDQIAAASEELTASAGQSAEASNHVAGTITEVAQGTAEQMQAVGGAAACIDRIAGEVEQVVRKTKQVSEISAQTAARAQKGEALMAEAITQMGSIEKAVNESAETVVRLGDNSKQIGQIVGVISGIAGQTNLLALNAAIEAARAGAQGKGFAVVAEEVRKLAEQSQQATEEISKLIAGIQQDTAQAVRVMETGTGEVKNGSEAIHNVGGAFKDIMQMIGGITMQMKGIAQSAEQLSAGSGEVVTAIRAVDEVSRKTVSQTETISAATEEQSASMQEIASFSQTLAQMAQKMQEMVKQFKL